MPLTRSFKETIQARAKRDAAFRKELLRESVESIRRGLAQARKGAGRPADEVFNELEREDA